MNSVAIMFSLLMLLTAALCAPVTKDPYDLLAQKDINNHRETEEGEDNIDKLDRIFKDLIKEYRRDEGQLTLNKFNDIDVGKLLELFEHYLRYKETGKINDEVEMYAELAASDGDLDTVDGNSYFRATIKGVFEYIDANIEEILDELISKMELEVDKDADSTKQYRGRSDDSPFDRLEEKLHAVEELVDVVFSPETTLEQSDKILKRSSSATDLPKEAPLVDVELDVGTKATHDYNEFNMRQVYEKRGAICTLITGYSKTPIYVISTCRLGFARSNIWELCEHREPFSPRMHQESIIDIRQTPVQDTEGFVYRNVYCAQCNDVTLVQAWTTKIDCEHMQPLSISDGTDQVTLMKEFDASSVGCVRRLNPAIPRMIHQCSHIDVISTMRYHTNRIGTGGKTDSSPFPLSFSILMNFGFDGKTHILFSTTANPQTVSVTCNENEKYDPQFQKCRPIVCYDGYQLVGATCEKIPTNNADAATDPDDLSNLQDAEEPLQIILTIKNITYGDIYMLRIAGIEGIVIDNLANMFNISKARIQNLTLSLVNSTGLANGTEELIEIHRFTTPLPSKLVSVQTAKQLGLPEWGGDIEPTQAMVDIATKREREPTRSDKVINAPIIHPENDEGSYVVYGSNGRDGNFDTPLRKKGEKNKELKSEITDKMKGHKESKQMKAGVEAHHDDMSGGLTDSTESLWEKSPGMSVRIAFVLKPAHKNRTLLEKSVKTVVQFMSDLIHSDTFSLTINGTDFKVQGVENTPQGTSIDEFCKKGVHPMLDETEFDISREYDNSTGENVTVIVMKETDERFFPGEYDLTVNIESRVGNLSQTEISSFVFVCNMPKISEEKCGRVVLSKDEYNLFENKSIGFANRTYNMSEYEYVDQQAGTVGICTPSDWVGIERIYDAGKWTLACGEDLVKVVIAESYLTFILGVISLICMLSVLITYGLFDKLRNLPGVNTMNLTFSLFMGELVFITSGWIQPHQAWLCSAVGMLLHYLFLASFFWMNVMSFDVFRTFGNKCILTRIRNKKKYFPRYLLYAWGSPLLIVTFCGVLDFTDLVDGVDIGYGGKSVTSSGPGQKPFITNSTDSDISADSHVYSIGCWIQQPVASMAAFGGPMILILLGNTVMFIRTIICIRASSRDARSSVRNSSLKKHMTGRDDVMLYIRMSTVMGFTWVFGLASSIISAFAGSSSHAVCIILHLLGILFIVFNCSQGIFIFFAFLINRRILAMYKGLIERMKTGRARPISISSSRSTLATNVSQTSLSNMT